MNQAKDFIEKHHMISPGDHVIAAVSGGADSVCLFHVLRQLQSELGFTLSVVHVEHGIRKAASIQDAEFVKQLAFREQIEYQEFKVNAPKFAAESGFTLEEAARELRYKCFRQETDRVISRSQNAQNVKIAVAHHLEDQAETMVFRLCRGTGVRGMRGISPVNGQIIRPLLKCTKEDILIFLQSAGYSYCTDETNQDIRYSRNRIRNRILPEIKQINDRAVFHMDELAQDLTELDQYMSEQSEILYNALCNDRSGDWYLNCDQIETITPILRRYLYSRVLQNITPSLRDITRRHLESIDAIALGGTGKSVKLPYDISVSNSYHRLVFVKDRLQEEKQNEANFFEWSLPDIAIGEKIHYNGKDSRISFTLFDTENGMAEIQQKKYTKQIDYDKIVKGLCLRTRRSGDYLVIDAQGRRQKLKSYFINEKVSREKRGSTLLLADGDHIAWVTGGRISEAYKITESTRKILEIQYVEEQT
ncbi:MAG: tRNA lysidine(34) synthetase TilS [Lachnospiraceae bacterium]